MPDMFSAADFHPPTPEQVAAHLEKHPLTGPSPWIGRLPLILLGLLVVAMFFAGAGGLVLIWLAMAGLIIFWYVRSRRSARRQAKLNRIHELAMLRHYRPALRLAWRLLPDLTASPSQYERCAAIIGHCLDDLGSYEAALTMYDHSIGQLPRNHPAGPHLQIQRAIAALSCDRLTDADDSLRSLRGKIDDRAPNPLFAGYRLATLVQCVRTGHFADAVEDSDHLLDHLRPLGVEAGYGHALMALCYHHLAASGGGDNEVAYAREAGAWWRRATLLLPAAALVGRFPELAAMREH